MSRPFKPIEGRFMARINRVENGCWEWTGETHRHGYGLLSFGRLNRKVYRAHRLSYELFVGPIPDGLLVLHKCDNKLCVNPDHLELGDHSKNLKDAWNRGRRGPRKSKVSDSDFIYIYNNPQNLTQVELSEMFGITRSRVNSIQHLHSKNDGRRLLSLS